MNESTVAQPSVQETMGIDLGDRESRYCVLDAGGTAVLKGRVPTTKKALANLAAERKPMRVVLEAGTHSAWVSRIFLKAGHSVVVANPRKLAIIYKNQRKNDAEDAELLARVGRLDPVLLSPILHRAPAVQTDLAMLRSRDALVGARTKLINHVRGVVKSIGERLPSCSTGAFPHRAAEEVPEELRTALLPVVDQVDSLGKQIQDFDRQIVELASTKYPAAGKLASSVPGVASLTALAFVLTVEDPHRFPRSRSVAAYLGLVPRQDDSGKSTPQLGITKAGDSMVRKLLVGSAQYALGPFGPDSDLRRWGLALAERGGKNAKKRSVVAVARKLAVLLLRLWVTGQTFKPFRAGSPAQAAETSAVGAAEPTRASDGNETGKPDRQVAPRPVPKPRRAAPKQDATETPAGAPEVRASSARAGSRRKRAPVEYELRAVPPTLPTTEASHVDSPPPKAGPNSATASPVSCNRAQGAAAKVTTRATGLTKGDGPKVDPVDRASQKAAPLDVASSSAPSPTARSLADASSPETPPAAPTAAPLSCERAQVDASKVKTRAAGLTKGDERQVMPVDRASQEAAPVDVASTSATPPPDRFLADASSPETPPGAPTASPVQCNRAQAAAAKVKTRTAGLTKGDGRQVSPVDRAAQEAAPVDVASTSATPPPDRFLADASSPETPPGAPTAYPVHCNRAQAAAAKVKTRAAGLTKGDGCQVSPVDHASQEAALVDVASTSATPPPDRFLADASSPDTPPGAPTASPAYCNRAQAAAAKVKTRATGLTKGDGRQVSPVDRAAQEATPLDVAFTPALSSTDRFLADASSPKTPIQGPTASPVRRKSARVAAAPVQPGAAGSTTSDGHQVSPVDRRPTSATRFECDSPIPGEGGGARVPSSSAVCPLPKGVSRATRLTVSSELRDGLRGVP